METLFASGLVAELILLVLALEAVALVAAKRLLRGGPPLRSLLPFLAAGACFALALRGALTGASWVAVAPWLGLAFLAHLLDLAARWTSNDKQNRQEEL